MNRLQSALAALAAFGIAGTAGAADVVTSKEEIVGTWKLTSYTVTTGEIETKPFGDTPGGYLVMDDDLHGFVLLFNQNRTPPAASPATDTEAAALFRSMVVWTAGCDLDPAGTPDGSKLSCVVDQSWNPLLLGTTRVCFFRVDGDTLHVKSITQPNAQNGQPAVAVLSYVRD